MSVRQLVGWLMILVPAVIWYAKYGRDINWKPFLSGILVCSAVVGGSVWLFIALTLISGDQP